MNTAIKVEGLGKRYRIGARRERYKTLSDALSGWIREPLKRLRSFGQSSHREEDSIWALDDISFDVEPGEVIGIIGRNGAGKTTLLKILTEITDPTKGRVEIRGRVASLLEVGTGFHPELTGRENTFLNGAILGMTRKEVASKFNDIVEFAEIEKFIDTPVKRYSSGMYVRLAFAVAAHLEPEILLVDEVLAVGDVSFQRRCLGKMEGVAKSGRTVLLVSHNMASIRQLCPKCIWIDQGRVRQIGPSHEVVDAYMKDADQTGGTAEVCFSADEKKAFQLEAVRLLDDDGEMTQQFDCDHDVRIEMDCILRQRVPGLYGYISIERLDGTVIMVSDSFDAPPNPLDDLPKGRHRLCITVPKRTLGPGEYRVYLNFTSPQHFEGFTVDSPGVVCTFHLSDYTSRRGDRRPGSFSTQLPWAMSKLS